MFSYELFVEPHYPIHRLKTPLYDEGDLMAGKEHVRAAIMLHLEPEAGLINTTVRPHTQVSKKRTLQAVKSNELVFIGQGGVAINFIGQGSIPLNFVTVGYCLEQIGRASCREK